MNLTILVVLGIIWGASYLFIKVGGAEIPPITFVAGRATIAVLAVASILMARHERFTQWRRELWLPLLVLGLANVVIPFTLITWGETEISSGATGILAGTMPLFTLLLSCWITHDEQLDRTKLAGVVIGFLGVVILFLPDVANRATASLFGSLAIVIASLCYAFALIVAHNYLKDISNLTLEFGQLLLAALILVPLSLLIDQPWSLRPSLAAVGSLLVLSLLGTAFGYFLYFWLIERLGPTGTSLVSYISPVSAIALGVLVLHEEIGWNTVVGGLSVIVGIGFVTRVRHPGRGISAIRRVEVGE